uniref:Uncharacterized protein n=2 Tax=Eukaryota TaxID=2759 RepID=A0A6T5UWT3_9EUKA|mmetsp:Transcript_2478/g.5897  ORF Transcript_2478/g.5897 Transcript_2478/m.5897 type:complete len:135 (+) Transcript_2478:90-494(+)
MRVTNLSEPLAGVFVVLGLQKGDIVFVGPSGHFFRSLPSNSPVTISFDLIGLRTGVHKLGPILLYDERGKKITECTPNYSVQIKSKAAAPGAAAGQSDNGAEVIPIAKKDTLSQSNSGDLMRSNTFGSAFDSLI